MATRKPIPLETETALLTTSRRRCCLCYVSNGDLSWKRQGQIAHVDRNPDNNKFGNLAWLCLDHHDQYDSRTSQSKGITPQELAFHRDALHNLLLQSGGGPLSATTSGVDTSLVATNVSYLNGGLKHLIRIDLLILPSMEVSGTYAIRSEYSDQEEERLTFGFVGRLESPTILVTFPSGQLPYPTDPRDPNRAAGRAVWTIEKHGDEEALAIATYGRDNETFQWGEYTMRLNRFVRDQDFSAHF